MPNLPLGDDLKTLFEEITSGNQPGSDIRAILVQNDSGTLRLIETLPEESTDKEDFQVVLSKFFSKEPTKPGYALYRLDSKSPAGLYEWLNCAYRPEGAKVRDKMQYTLTQASLFAGLSEQHFLDTIYGGTASEFSFPTRLRNQRKHDYQNPQLSTSGKKPAEAAGTGTAGKRNFDRTTFLGSMPQSSSTSAQKSVGSPFSETKLTSAPTQSSTEVNETNPLETTRATTPPAAVADIASTPQISSDKSQEGTTEEEKALASGIDEDKGVVVEAAKGDEEAGEVKNVGEEETLGEIQEAVQDPAPLSAIDAKSSEIETVTQQKEEAEEEDVMNQSIAPSNQASLTKEAVDKEEPTPVEHKEQPLEPAAPTVASTAALTTPISQEINKPSTSTTSVGMGTGSQGLETEKERHLANLKSEEMKLKSGGNQGGSHLGFPWQEDVEPALRGLAKKLGGFTSEWNLVILKIDLSKEEIELASPPRFVPPGDMSEALPDSEPCYAFYSHPDTQGEIQDSSQIAVIYVCPLHSSVRQRMLYSANLAITSNRVDGIQGLDILKRIETSDPKDLTAAFFAEELLGVNPTEEAKSFSRPKRPGRK